MKISFRNALIALAFLTGCNNQHETLVSVGVAWGIGHLGAQAVGADVSNTVQPGVFFGKGFGDLPDSLSWLRPFAVTGAIVDEIPVGSGGRALAPNVTTGKLQSVVAPAVETLHWGFSVQYSTYYLTSRFNGGPPKEEPLNQLVPLVEFNFDSPRGQYTAATNESGLRLCGGGVADHCRSHCAAKPSGRERHRLSCTTSNLSRRFAAVSIWEDQPNRSQTAWH
jgi:hypothetical protein